MDGKHFLVRRDRLSEHDTVTLPREPLAPGAVELRVDRFGFTTNNLTYGVVGDALGYWRFFPAARPGWGRLPVWGFGTVVRSAMDGIAPGERFYGFFPMSSHLIVQPGRIDDAGFLDAAAHRSGLSSVYNQYLRTTHDPTYRADTEPYQMVLRPVFATAYFLADYLREQRWFGAEAILVSSASSKLACALAFVLAGAARDAREVVGLTSPANAGFVTRLGLFDRVVAYDELATLPVERRAVLVDIAGSSAVRGDVHRRLGDALGRSISVGATHGVWPDAAGAPSAPETVTFFTPAWIKHRTEQWTPGVVQQRLAAAWDRFLGAVRDPARGWLTIELADGEAAVARAYDALVAGRGGADRGHVLSLAAEDSSAAAPA